MRFVQVVVAAPLVQAGAVQAVADTPLVQAGAVQVVAAVLAPQIL